MYIDCLPLTDVTGADAFRTTTKPCVTWLSRVLADGHISFVPLTQTPHVRRHWITTLRTLRSRPSGKFSSEVISIWVSLGKAHGFSERAETAWLARGNNAKATRPDGEPWDHCGWSGCMCYEQRPLYRLLACTGCRKEYYCGEKCQKRYAVYFYAPVILKTDAWLRAWEEGHRYHCSQGHKTS